MNNGNSPIRVLLIAGSERDVRRLQGAIAGRSAAPFDLISVAQFGDAIRTLNERKIDAVLLDLALTDGQRMEPLQQLHEHRPEVPILALTNAEDDALAMRALKAGAQDSLVKGELDGPLLVRAIRYAIERQQLHAALREMSLASCSRWRTACGSACRTSSSTSTGSR
jgi:phosphoserine phosphatase RsbU/P